MQQGSTRWFAVILLAALLAPTALLGLRALRTPVDAANAAMKSRGTPEERAYLRRVELFGEDHVVVLAFAPGGKPAAAAGQLEGRRAAGRSESAVIEADRGADEMTGAAAAAEVADAVADALLDVEGVIDVIDLPAEDSDWTVLAVLLEGDGRGGGYSEATRRVIARASAEAAARIASTSRGGGQPSVRLLIGGQPVGELAIADGVRRESRRLLPWVVAVLALLAGLRYRRPLPVIALLAPPFAAIAWTGGLYDWLGYRLDPVSSLLPPVVLTVGVAGGVHLVEGFLGQRRRGATADQAVRDTLAEIALPALLAAGTTVAGFLTLGVHAIPALRRFGEFAALGVGLSCLLTLSAGPAVLLLGARGRSAHRAERADGEAASVPGPGERIAGWIARRRGVVILGALLLLTLGASAWPRLHVDTDPASVLPESSGFRQDFEAMSTELGGVESFDLLVPGGAAQPQAVRRLEGWLRGREEVAQLAPRQESDGGDLLLTAVVRPGGTHARERLFGAAEQAAAGYGLPGTVATGMLVRVARDSGLIVRGQVLATSLTLLVLFVAGAAGFRSWRLGLLGLLPNVVPAVLVYGALAAAGRTLSVSTVMISSVMLGLVVDDTIHFLVRYARARRSGRPRGLAVSRALEQAGLPIALTSVVLAAGFTVPLLFGELLTTREFGALAAGTILLALAADLLLLPALLLWRREGGEHG